MNAIFFTLFMLSLIFCLVFSPDKAIFAMLEGANKSITLIFTLASVYCVWMGVYNLLESAKITNKIARLFKKPVQKLFGVKDEKCVKLISLNLASNALGLGGIATPLGIEACKSLEMQNNVDGRDLLVIISASSIQLLPTSVISLLVSFGSKNAEKVILPSLICTLFSTTCAIFLYILHKNLKIKLKNKGGKK